MSDPTCSVEDCEQPRHARGLCGTHYSRQRRGLPLGVIERRVTHQAGGICVGPECGRPSIKRGMCEAHYSQTRNGKALGPLRYRTDEPRVCIVCGARDWPPNRRRKACSANCYVILMTYGGPRPTTSECVLCGASVDLTVLTPSGRRKQRSTKFCATCKRARMLRHKTSVAALAKRDGTRCGICGDAVDMTLRRPASLLGPSVDHIIPRGQGGTNDPDNVQLAHLYCNFVKNDRTGFTI